MSRKSGFHFEKLAAEFLLQQGLELLTQNFMARRGELDLVMRDRDTLVFIEVRFRKNAAFGSAADSVTLKKQRRLIKAAQSYLQLHRQLTGLPCRFDVIAISGTEKSQQHPKIDWIKNAFLIT